MNKYLALFKSDALNTRRDPTLLVLLFVPFLILALLRFGVPYLTEYIPETEIYYNLIIGFFCVLVSAFPAFIVSFIVLDEKDANVILALRTTPLSSVGYVISRTGFIVLFGFINAFIILKFNGLISFSKVHALLIALNSSLTSPPIVFFTIAFARNKIEGVTLMKILNVSLILPAMAIFVVNPVRFLFGIFPAFWIYILMDSTTNILGFYTYFTIGLFIIVTINYIMIKYAESRLFR